MLVGHHLHVCVKKSIRERCSFSLLQQCVACLDLLIWMGLKMGGRWLYRSCIMRYVFQDLSNVTRSILVQFPSLFFSIHFVSIHVVHPYNKMDSTVAWKKCVLFYYISLTSIISITYWQQYMTWLVAHWCHFQLMIHCFIGRKLWKVEFYSDSDSLSLSLYIYIYIYIYI